MATLAEEAASLRDLKERHSVVDSEAKELKAQVDQAQSRLFERMRHEGVGGIKVNGVNFVPAETQYGVIQDRDAFVAWALENDEGLLETKERKGNLNELIREKLDNGEALPPGVGFYVKEYISQRAGS